MLTYRLLISQERRCALCNAELADYEVDHVQPLGSFGSNSRSNLAALCVPCHSTKSRTESLSRLEPDPLSSEFAPDVYERFVDSPKPKQMYINAREFAEKGPRLYVDVIRCRYNALYTNVYPIPVFSPQDTIQPVKPGTFADYMWVDKGVPESHQELFGEFYVFWPEVVF